VSSTPDARVPARVRIGQRPDHVRWFRVVPRTGEWVNFAPPGMSRDDYEVDWVMHWAVDPDDADQPDVTIEIQLVDPEG
jgi:hypothetical protein